jgi:hypothetical protein
MAVPHRIRLAANGDRGPWGANDVARANPHDLLGPVLTPEEIAKAACRLSEVWAPNLIHDRSYG